MWPLRPGSGADPFVAPCSCLSFAVLAALLALLGASNVGVGGARGGLRHPGRVWDCQRSRMSILQRRTPIEFRGRVIGLHATMTRALVPIAMVGGGAIADLTGRNVPLVYGVCGALALGAAVVLASKRSTRDFLATP